MKYARCVATGWLFKQVLSDTTSQKIWAALDADPEALNRQMQQLWGASHGVSGAA